MSKQCRTLYKLVLALLSLAIYCVKLYLASRAARLGPQEHILLGSQRATNASYVFLALTILQFVLFAIFLFARYQHRCKFERLLARVLTLLNGGIIVAVSLFLVFHYGRELDNTIPAHQLVRAHPKLFDRAPGATFCLDDAFANPQKCARAILLWYRVHAMVLGLVSFLLAQVLSSIVFLVAFERIGSRVGSKEHELGRSNEIVGWVQFLMATCLVVLGVWLLNFRPEELLLLNPESVNNIKAIVTISFGCGLLGLWFVSICLPESNSIWIVANSVIAFIISIISLALCSYWVNFESQPWRMYDNSSNFQQVLQKVELDYQCCGLQGISDYAHMSRDGYPPESCCPTGRECQTITDFTNPGCLKILSVFFTNFMLRKSCTSLAAVLVNCLALLAIPAQMMAFYRYRIVLILTSALLMLGSGIENLVHWETTDTNDFPKVFLMPSILAITLGALCLVYAFVFECIEYSGIVREIVRIGNLIYSVVHIFAFISTLIIYWMHQQRTTLKREDKISDHIYIVLICNAVGFILFIVSNRMNTAKNRLRLI